MLLRQFPLAIICQHTLEKIQLSFSKSLGNCQVPMPKLISKAVEKALSELPKRKYKWSKKTEKKKYFIYTSIILHLFPLTFAEIKYTSSIL